MSEPVFLIDEDLIAVGKALSASYPGTIHISGRGDAPPKAAPDGALYSWCVRHNAVLVTADFNMLRDRATLDELVRRQDLRVVWIRQIRGQTFEREVTRIMDRWPHVRSTLASEPDFRGFVLRGNGQLRRYRTISDTVYEILARHRERR